MITFERVIRIFGRRSAKRRSGYEKSDRIKRAVWKQNNGRKLFKMRNFLVYMGEKKTDGYCMEEKSANTELLFCVGFFKILGFCTPFQTKKFEILGHRSCEDNDDVADLRRNMKNSNMKCAVFLQADLLVEGLETIDNMFWGSPKAPILPSFSTWFRPPTWSIF